jgi:hypothetical protein
MSDETKENPHLHDADTGTMHGVPAGAAEEESKGTPDSGRHQSETGPLQPEKK